MPIIREIIYGAVRRGAPLGKLLDLSGLTEESLRNSELHVPFKQAQSVWSHAIELTGDPLLGLHIGEDTTPSIVGLTGHLMQTSPDLKTAFEKVCAFNKNFTDMFRYELKQHDEHVILEYSPATLWQNAYPETASQAVDQALSGTLNVFELLSGKEIKPLKAEVTTGARRMRPEYERVLGAPIKFNADANRLYFTKNELDQPVLGYDKKLFTIFNTLLTQQKKETKKLKPLSNEVRRLLREVYQFKAPSLEVIAMQLNVVSRTLQRKLDDEGTNYRLLVEEMQQELSRELLKSDQSKVKTIAGMLGYSDTSSFRRAFKKWTKKSPKEFRKTDDKASKQK